MPLGPFDEQPAVDPRTPASTGPSLFDQANRVLQEQTTSEETALRRTTRGAESPDAAVAASRLARRYHVPTPVVARQLPAYQQRATDDDVVEAAKTNPRLGAWLAEDPTRAAAARPDLTALSALERAVSIGRNVGGAFGAGYVQFKRGLVGAMQAAAEFRAPTPEVTTLRPAEEQAFRAWAQASGITDVDAPESRYDYRGFWENHAARDAWQPGEHFPDTYKQHGHPTFSTESIYSIGANDGGTWEGETFTPAGGFAALARKTSQMLAERAERLRGPQTGAGFLEKAAYSGVESVGQMLPGLLVGVATGGTGTLLSLAGVTTGGSTYSDAREQGLSPERALAAGTIDGAIEVGTEFIPAHLLLGDLAKHTGLLTSLAHQVASEIPTEEVATALQDLNAWAFLPANKERTFADYLGERPSAAAATAVSVLTSVGLTTVGAHATHRVLEQLGEAAAASPTVQQDPALVQSLLEHADSAHGAATLYMAPDVFRTYFQDKGIDPAAIAASLTGQPNALAQAETAGLLEIPAARYAVTLAGTEHNAFFAKELSLSPDLHNLREAEAFAATEAAAAKTEADRPPTRRDQLRQVLTDQLVAGGRFRPQDAETQARLVEAGLGTMAEAAGEDPLTVYQQYGVQIARPDLDAATSARQTPQEAVADPTAPEVAPVAAPLPAPDVAPPPAALEETAPESAIAEPEPVIAEPEPVAAYAQPPADEPPPGPRPIPPERVGREEHAQALAALTKVGVAYGPGGLKVRVVEKSTPGRFELEVTERGQRRFEGDFSLAEGPALGAARLAALAVTPTARPVTPQVDQPVTGGQAYVLPTFVAGKGARTPTGTQQEVFRTFKRRLTKALKAKDWGAVIAEADAFQAYYEDPAHPPFPDDHFRWERAKDDALWAQRHAAPPVIERPLAPADEAPLLGPPPAPAENAAASSPAETIPETIPETVSPPAEEPVASPPEQAQTQEHGRIPAGDGTSEGAPDSHPGGDPPAGDVGGSVERPGEARARDLAGVEPRAATPGGAQPGTPHRSGKRGTAGRRPRLRAGEHAPRVGSEPGGGAGVHTPSHVDTADLAVDPAVAAAESRGAAPRHFVIDGQQQLTDGNWQAKLADNLAALRLLKALEHEGRLATDAEQQILTRYIGWGHTELKDVVEFEGSESTLARRDPRKQQARDELDQILTKEELLALGLSTANAHYSFSDLPRAMWAAVERLGFRGGSILEPAVGTGHFLGTMPGTLVKAPTTRLWAVEMEPIAAAIAKHLYQDAHVQNSPFQEANLPNDYFDLQISNVPFGRIPIFDPEFNSPARRPVAASVHNYYFGKALDLARPGGIIAFVTSRFTMDSRSDAVRRFLADRADLLGAVRLPDQAFKKTAGTDVVTDIIFLRKRDVGEVAKRGSDAWVESPVNEKISPKDWHGKIEQPVHTNSYFQKHPEHVLGVEDMSGKMAKSPLPQYNVPGTLTPDALQAALVRALPKNVYKRSTVAPRELAAVISKDIKQGSYQIDAAGGLAVYDKGTLAPSGLKPQEIERAKLFVPLRDAYQGVLDRMIAGAATESLETAQAVLLAHYHRFVAAFGLVNERANRNVIENDPNAGRILALEEVDQIKVAKGRAPIQRLKRLADIFTKRTYTPVVEATSAAGPASALTQSLSWKGGVDLAYMQGLTGQTEAALVTALEGEIFRDPVTGAYVPRGEYLSGDVTTKLAQAQAAASTDTAYAGHVAALLKVLPTQFTPEDFPTPFGATWVPVDIYRRFIESETGASGAEVTLMNSESRVHFYVAGYGAHEFLPAGADLAKWMEHGLNGDVPSISTKDDDGTVRVDPLATEAYRESLKQLRERWAEWWPADNEASGTLTKIYNGMFNREAPYVADGSHLHLAGANPAIKLHPWQKNVIWRALQTGNTLMAHAVGAGKTFAMIGVAGEWKRLGLAHKPLFVVPNHLTVDTERQFRLLYPAARVLVPTKEDFTPGNRARLIARIANNDWDAVIMAQSHFLRVGVKLETLKAFFKEQEDQLLADGAEQMNLSAEEFGDIVTGYGAKDKDATRALSGRSTPRSVKDIARAILSLRGRFQRRLDQSQKDSPVTFEELGTDGLLVDEAHLYKNLFFSTAKNNIAGLKGSDADRAVDMFLKVRHINLASRGRNVIFATGTPVSNTMSELYTMFRYLAQPTLSKMGMSGFDSWANGNAEATAEMEKSPTGGYTERTRLRKWTNLRELSAQFRKFSDVVTTQDLIDSKVLTLPTAMNGHPTVVQLEPHPDMADLMRELEGRLEQIKTGKVDPKDDNILKIGNEASMAAIDMRLVRPRSALQEDGRIPTAATLIARRYKQTAADRSTQLVFLDIGVPSKKDMPPLPKTITDSTSSLGELEADAPEADDGLVDLEAEGEAERLALASLGHDLDLYTDLRARLVAQGVRDDEIAYLHQAQTPFEQGQLYAAMNSGRIRVLFATTAKGGVGMNVQTKLKFIHHLDVPWKPADVEQRNGRIFRQKNENLEVEELRYVTKNSYDEYRWGLLAGKQASIVALMKGQLTSLDDVDPAQLDMQVAQALASGKPQTLVMLNLEREVQALRVRFKAYTTRINTAKRSSQAGRDAIARLTADRAALAATLAASQTWAQAPILNVTERPSYLRERGAPFDLKDPDARKALQARLETMMLAEPYQERADIGTGGPYDLVLHKTQVETYTTSKLAGVTILTAAGHATAYYVSVGVQVADGQRQILGTTPQWTVGEEKFPAFVRSLDTYLMPDRLAKLDADKAKTIAQWEQGLKSDLSIMQKTFGNVDQLREKERELAEVRAELGIERGVPQANTEGKSFGQPLPPDDGTPPGAPPPDRRGNVEFGVDRATGLPVTTINLMARADLSTFLHEAGHFFLEVFGDLANRVRAKDPATLTDDQRRLLDDYTQALGALGVGSRQEIGTAQHEQWAEAYETYLMEGHAPSLELLEPFARFRAWLLAIYRSVRGRAPVSPALRGVFDRMLASEDAIAAAEQDLPELFTTPEQAGMTPERFALYRADVVDAHRKRREALDRQMAAEVSREQTAQWQAERAEIEAEVTEDLLEEPVYRALTVLREGLPSADPLTSPPVPMPFDHLALVVLIGAARVEALPPGLTVMEGGTDPDLVAELTGYDSLEALIQAITTAPPLASAVATETERRMLAEHGSLLLDGSIHEKARAATASEDHDAILRAEIKALWVKHEQSQRTYERRWFEAEAKLRIAIAEGAKQVEIDALTKALADLKAKARGGVKHEQSQRTYERRWFEAEAKLRIAIAEGAKQVEIDALTKALADLKAKAGGGAATIRRAQPSAEELRRLADIRIAETPIRRLNPAAYWTAARRAGADAIAKAARQDLAGAITAKTLELTNLAYYRAAARAKANIDATRAWVAQHDRPAARGRMGKAGPAYLDQWDGILDRFEFKRVSGKVLDRRSALSEFVSHLEAQGLPITLPAILLNEARRTNYQALTVEEFFGVTDGLRQLAHIAGLKNRLLRKGAQRDLEAVTGDLSASIYDHGTVTDTPLEFTPTDEKHRHLADFFASHAKISRLARALDGHQDGGPMWEHVIRPINIAGDAQVTRKQAAGAAYAAILETHYPGRALTRLQTKRFIPAIRKSLSHEAILSIALNWGNQTSRDRLAADPRRHFDEAQLLAILETLDKTDWDFAQATWDYLHTYWPEIAAKQERVTGLAPEKVEALQVHTKFGTYPGGYYPLAYDSRLSLRAGQHQMAGDLKLAALGNYVAATTKRGHVEKRLENVHLSVRLDLGVAFDHLEQVIHDLTHHEMLIDVSRVLRSPNVQTAILETKGDLVYQQFTRAVLDIAIDTVPARGPIEKAANWARSRTQIALLGLNLWTAAQQPLGLFNGASRVGPVWVARGMKRWLRDASTLQSTVGWIASVSPMMAHRSTTATQDLADLRHSLRQPGGWFDGLLRQVSGDRLTMQQVLDGYLWHIGLMQRVADVPTWIGQYEKSMAAGEPEARAVHLADQAVLDSQGGGQMKDLAQVQRGGPLARTYMMFYSYGSTVMNSAADVYGATKPSLTNPAGIATFLGHLALLYVMPALATLALSRAFGRTGADDDEDPALAFLKDVSQEMLSTALNGFVLVREFTGLLGEGTRGYAGPAGARVVQLFYELGNQAKQLEADEALAKATNAAAGVVFRYPAMQVQRTVDGWVALEEGRTHNPLALLFGPPAKHGSRAK